MEIYIICFREDKYMIKIIKSKKGFTMVELLIVIAILGIPGNCIFDCNWSS